MLFGCDVDLFVVVADLFVADVDLFVVSMI